MKTLACLSLAVLVTSCGPSNSTTDTSETTSKTTTTVTTTTTPTPTPSPDVAPPPPPVVSSTLTQSNLDRIQKNMSPSDVEAILGQPSSSHSEPIPIVGGTQTTYSYESGNSSVTIIFKNNKVMEKNGTFGSF